MSGTRPASRSRLPCGGEDPEPAVVLVEFGALQGEPAGDAVRVDDHLAVVEEGRGVGVHAVAGEAVLDARAGPGPGVDEVGLVVVVVPQRARVDEALALLEEVRAGPRAAYLGGVDLEDALVGVAPEDPEAFVVVPQRRCPDTAVVARGPELPCRFQALEGVADQGPVDQVAGVQQRQAGDAAEAGRGEVEVVADADDVRVGPVGVQDGVRVRLVGHWLTAFRTSAAASARSRRPSATTVTIRRTTVSPGGIGSRSSVANDAPTPGYSAVRTNHGS